MTDLSLIYSLNKWELDAILEGLHYRQIEDRENLSALALELRYTLNAKKVSAGKLSKRKDRDKVRSLFNGNHSTGQQSSDNLAEKLKKLNDYFMNR